MIFDPLYESAQRGELLLVEGGMCHWHLRRDGQITIREIISTQPGAGSRMLDTLRQTAFATSILAKCPAALSSNAWYAKRGFLLESTETTSRGTLINVWRLTL